MEAEKFLNEKEAPAGYRAALKENAKTANACDSCDARKLCVENKKDWCVLNRCMADALILDRDGTEIRREDACSVYFVKQC